MQKSWENLRDLKFVIRARTSSSFSLFNGKVFVKGEKQ